MRRLARRASLIAVNVHAHRCRPRQRRVRVDVVCAHCHGEPRSLRSRTALGLAVGIQMEPTETRGTCIESARSAPGLVIVHWKQGGGSPTQFYCLPDTVGPRGPKTR
jgi:hypothetical protein